MSDRLKEIEQNLEDYLYNAVEDDDSEFVDKTVFDIRYLLGRVRELERLNRDLRLRYGRSAITCACRFEAEDSDEPTTQCAYHKAVAEENAWLREALDFYADCHLDEGKRARKALGRE